MKEAKYYTLIDDYTKEVQCKLCPHNCLLKKDKTGKCKARKNIDGKLYSLTYGVISSVAFDPVEKKPLYHFYPGSIVLSIGSFGCNFKCGFCQNWEISQVGVQQTYEKEITPQKLLQLAKKYKNNIGISYTYNEPLINFEYILETAEMFKKEGYKNILVTNGYINKQPLLEILNYIDAANIDLKSFNKNFYEETCGGELKFVLQTIETFLEHKKHIEITTLIIPTKNDSQDEITKIVDYIKNLSIDIPLHFSRYFPMYKFNIEATPIDTMIKIYEIAKQKLNYVYLGNILEEKYNSTFCPNCGKLLIRRLGYNTEVVGLEYNRCKYCKEEIKVFV